MAERFRRYTVMHGESKVVSIRSDGSCTIYSHRKMPYNLYLEKCETGEIDTRLNNLVNFYYWCSSRMLSLDRKYAKEILNSLGQKQAVTDRERAEIAISYHALSLTDIYWVKCDREKVCFADISLYSHKLGDAFVDVCLRGRQLTLENSRLMDGRDAAGDIATTGIAAKAWIRRDDGFYLLKDGDRRDVESELLSSKILDCFDVAHVRYERDTYDGETVSKSRIITSPEKSITAMEFIDVYALNHGLDLYKMILSKDAYQYYMMNIMDYLLGNTDRHMANWGFWIDNRNNSLLGLYPLMDFNRAFNSYDTLDGALCQTTEKPMTQLEGALEAVRAVGLNRIKEIDYSWFSDENQREMFKKRLAVLEEAVL
ncbi:MAG: hypothetical protein Q4E35_08980 [Eubacteriales bacterium]|nr:hypothetical protein [Eubacteriales bacterium]